MSQISPLPAVPQPVIRLDAVSKAFATRAGRFDAVRDVSLSIRAGDTFGIIGKSGAGKSTLLRLINLLERPDAGAVHVAGTELTALSKRELRAARQHIGMIFQQFNLLQNETVFENVAFPLRVHGGRTREHIAARVRDCLDIVGLTDKTASYPAQLSGGQKQRVAIARALASEPAVLLCDEPTSALDPETTRSVLAVLRDINKRLGVTIVIVTHELAVVRALCRHVAVMENGQVLEQAEISGANVHLSSALGRELIREATHPYEEVGMMLDTFVQLLPELGVAVGQTFLMLAIALAASILLGGPLGVLVFLTGPGQSLDRPVVHRLLSWTVNTVRSFPFIILLVALVPFTRVIAGTSIGPVAAAVPLSFAAIPYFARLVEQCLRDVPRGVIEAAHAAGASELQIVRRVLLVEARSGLVLALTVLAVSFLSYSAVAGVVGGGGIGDLAIRYGYYRFQTDVMVLTVALLVVLVQIIQVAGNTVARRIDKR